MQVNMEGVAVGIVALVQEQAQRVEKGWFPKNPNRKEPMDCTK